MLLLAISVLLAFRRSTKHLFRFAIRNTEAADIPRLSFQAANPFGLWTGNVGPTFPVRIWRLGQSEGHFSRSRFFAQNGFQVLNRIDFGLWYV